HSAFLTLELLQECDYNDDCVRSKCAFTTHTPVKAGHDKFSYDLSYQILGKEIPWHIRDIATHDMLSMTDLAINMSHKTNSVSVRHQEVCKEMFPGKEFSNITNGIHHLTWVSDSMSKLFDKNLKGWQDNPEVFENAIKSISDEDLLKAKKKEKKKFIKWINNHPEFFAYHSKMHKEDFFDEETLTFVFARRFVSYKRPALIFRLRERLRLLGYKKIQIIFAGKCHPNDGFCNGKIEEIRHEARKLRGQVRVAVIPDYNIDIAKKLVAGADVWLNNPIKPREASGTSGMKSALNGGLNCSILDGWWIEAFNDKPLAGWGFGEKSDELDEAIRDDVDAGELCDILEEIIYCYYKKPKQWTKRMKTAISLISYFNTYRCVEEYDKIMWSDEN
ncbi:alpha-glucan family phosphorylase, partial [Candidatus Harpocratesius sp.]